MPGYSCSIKERMLYSSCKGPLLDAVERQLGIAISRKVSAPCYIKQCMLTIYCFI